MADGTVYLNEAGDTGFKFARGSSRYFVVALLQVVNPMSIQAAAQQLRQDLKLRDDFEFKFHHLVDDRRLAFLDMLRRQDLNARVMVIDKHRLNPARMRERDAFYGNLVRLLLDRAAEVFQDEVVVLDESARSKNFKQNLSSYLRTALNADRERLRVRALRYQEPRSDSVVQAARMVAGALHANYHRGNGVYLATIRERIGDLWEWQPAAQ